MSNRLQTKLRFVRCPRCAKVLQEPEQVPMYACGGCDTILQAKYYRTANNSRGSILGQEDAVQSNVIAHALSGGESEGSSQRSGSAGPQSLDLNEEMDQGAVVNCKSEPIETVSSTHHTSVSDEPSFLANEENGETDNKTDQFEQRDCVVDQNQVQLRAVSSANEALTESCTVEDCNQKQIGDLGSPRGSSSHNESHVLENGESEQFHTVNGAKEDEDDQLELPDDISFDNPMQVEAAKSSREASVLDEPLGIQNKEPLKLAPENRAERVDDNGKEGNGRIDCLSEKVEGINLGECPLPTEITQGGDEDSTVITDVCGSDGVSASSSAKDMMAIGEATSNNVSRLPWHESSSMDNVVEPSRRQTIENLDDSAVHESEHLKSTETVNAVGNLLKVAPRSPIKGSFAYEEGISSFGENDDPVPRQQEQVGEEKLPGNNVVSGSVGAGECPEWNNELLGRKTCETQAKNSASMLLDENLNGSMLGEDESDEENQLHLANRTRPNRRGIPPRVPPLYRSSEVVYETGSSSSHAHDKFPGPDMRHHPYRYEPSETWLRKTYVHRGIVGSRRRYFESGWREGEFLPMYYSYETSGEIYQRSGCHHSYIDRSRQSESWSQTGSLPRMPYSGGALNGRYQIPYPYVHRHHHPDDLRWSAQLPPTGVCCRKGLCIAPSREISWDLYESYPTSPQHPMEFKSYPWAHDTILLSDDQKYEDQIMKRIYLREKRQAVKRHWPPVAGGAPFITCYFCFRVLRLPGDFLLPRRRTHRLRCGSCLKILEFSLENECCFAGRMPSACEEAQTDVGRNGNITSEAPKIQDADDRKKLSDNFVGVSGREKSKPESMNEERTGDGVGSSVQERQMKVTWQLPARTKSPLHRLMGYSSPCDLINGQINSQKLV